jgi:hypothetical protein
LKDHETASIDEDVGKKRNICTLLAGVYSSAAIMENTMEVPQKLKMELTCILAILLLSITPKKMKSVFRRDGIRILIHCSIIHNNQNIESS